MHNKRIRDVPVVVLVLLVIVVARADSERPAVREHRKPMMAGRELASRWL